MAKAQTKKTKERPEFKAIVGKSNYPTIGKILNNKEGGVFAVLADNVTLLIDGEEFPLTDGRYINLVKPTEHLKFRIDNGYIKEDDIERITDAVKASEKVVRYEMQVVSPK